MRRRYDVSSIAREVVQFDNSVRALPLDTDNVALGWREDVFSRHGLSAPETLEDLVTASELLNGKDHNGDGVPDFGICLSPQPNYFYAFAAPIFYATRRTCDETTLDDYGGGAGTPPTCNGGVTGQNMFFDTDDFTPLLDNAGFRYAVDLHRRILASSNCQEQQAAGGHYTMPGVPRGDFKCDRRKAMMAGRCAGVISMPGTMTKMLLPWDRGGSTSPQPRFDGRWYTEDDYDPTTGNITWQVQSASAQGYWGRRLRFPGSTKVYDHATKQLVACTATVCPKAIRHSVSGELVNYAPFFAEGGESYAIRATAASQKQDIMFDLLTWFSSLPIDVLPLTGIYRASHFDERSRERFISRGWPQVMVDDLFDVLSFYFLDDENEGGNAVKDLLIPGFSEYMGAFDEELYERFLLNLTVSFGGITDAEFDRSFQSFVARLTDRYRVITARYGKLEQLERWRKALNMPSLSRDQLCAWPDRSELTFTEASDCASASTRPCTETGCGRYAQCLQSQIGSATDEIVLCTCLTSDTTPASDFLMSRACVPTIASTDQQRVFWTLSMLLFGTGFVLCLVVINEFRVNPVLSPSKRGATMWSFAAIAIPDFVLSAMYFVFHFVNLIRGVEMPQGPCEAFALLTTMCVHATLLGPPIVGLVTLRKYSALTKRGQLAAQPSKLTMAAILCLPWVIGLAIGLVARADGKSGSYRGLLCYNKQWDSVSTGGLTIAVFAVSTLVTAASYATIAYKVRSHLRLAGSAHADQSSAALLKRGGALVLIYFLCWACFVVVVGLNMSHQPVSVTTEMLTALVIGLQVRASTRARARLRMGMPSPSPLCPSSRIVTQLSVCSPLSRVGVLTDVCLRCCVWPAHL